uniref:Transmembrane protein n=1 Tax=Anopheles christyi TaxID=43041 RepID=A0A182K477_9DIPT
MSTAYKHLYSCVTFLIFVFVLNFYKNRIHVNREREAAVRTATKLKRAGALNRPHAAESGGEAFFLDFSYLDLELAGKEPSGQWDRSKQYPGRCLDVEVFFVFASKRTTTIPRVLDGPEGLHYRSTVLLSERSKKREQEQAPDNGVPNSSIYVFLSVLVVLLLAAGVDIAKHLTGTDGNGPRGDAQRRLSLQNYQALIREKQKQFRMMKQHYSQPSMSIQRSVDESVAPYAGTFARMEEAPSLGMSAKAMPAPLLRRQSVPTLMRSQLISSGGGTGGGGSTFSTVQHVQPGGRRTSIDSFWDVDHTVKAANGSTSSNGSPSEVRRRVRMLHRH